MLDHSSSRSSWENEVEVSGYSDDSSAATTSVTPAASPEPARATTNLSMLLTNRDRQSRDPGWNDDADRRTVRDDNAPAPGCPKPHCPPPPIRCDPEEGDFKAVTSNVRVRPAGVARDGRDDAKDIPPGCHRNESQVVVELPLAADGERHWLSDGGSPVARSDRDLELRHRRGTQDERESRSGNKSLHAAPTPRVRDRFHATIVTTAVALLAWASVREGRRFEESVPGTGGTRYLSCEARGHRPR